MHVAIIGCGQLARMMALAGWNMNVTFSFLAEPNEGTDCVKGLGTIVQRTPELTGEALYKALGEPDVVTVEREHVDTALLDSVAPFCPAHPNPRAIEVTQHRGREKDFISKLGIKTAPYKKANGKDSLAAAIAEMGLPVIVKSSEEGYDGKGQWKLDTDADTQAFLAEDGLDRDFVVEGLVAFEREVSIITARSASGVCSAYPLAENDHKGGILITSIAPADADSGELSEKASNIAKTLIEALDYVGILSIELFVVGDELVVNELAPRVHNSGHWTQAADVTSQFENHLRAILDLQLGNTQPTGHSAMVNVLGRSLKAEWLTANNVQLHDYNKSPRPGRKVGHLNIYSNDRDTLVTQMNELRALVYTDEA
ncbi:MAG: 5-(carboxyamino)imidazole ribonucleotide synthase [Pontibacterium sp.]